MFTAKQLAYLSSPERRQVALEELHHWRRALLERPRELSSARLGEAEEEVRGLLLDIVLDTIREVDALLSGSPEGERPREAGDPGVGDVGALTEGRAED